jgi:L-malate glycosyltransferase
MVVTGPRDRAAESPGTAGPSGPAALSVLHVCSDFARQAIYNLLVSELDGLGIRQFVYVPVRTAQELQVNRNDALQMTSYRYSHILRPWHRLFFRTKIRTVLQDLCAHAGPAACDVVHAHFLYSDGVVALRIKQQLGKPYVVAVRNTDVHAFMRLRPDLRWLCWDVIEQAERVIFITPAYRELLLRRVPRRLRGLLEQKALIVPNGLARFWIDNAGARHGPHSGRLRLLYVGDFSRNKNLKNALRAVAMLNEEREVGLTLVGAGGDGEAQIDAMLASGRYPFVRRVGRIADRAALAAIYRDHDMLLMPSFRETFGVVYLEALSQGLPIIYTKGQGVDGYFEPGAVGAAVNPSDPRDIAAKIAVLAAHLDRVRPLCVEQAKAFDWSRIAACYRQVYERAAAAARPQ